MLPVKVPHGPWHSVPLSWVPPMVKFASVECTAIDWNWVATKPALFRLVQLDAAVVDFQIPPSLPVQITRPLPEGELGSISIACSSACRPVWLAVKVGVPNALVTFVRMCAGLLSPGPPK